MLLQFIFVNINIIVTTDDTISKSLKYVGNNVN